jgi:predicted small lipoprotein YifL
MSFSPQRKGHLRLPKEVRRAQDLQTDQEIDQKNNHT